jgi:ketosteroid isomerase-like protein
MTSACKEPVHADIAQRMVALLETADISVVLDMLAPDALLWHNSDKLDVDAAEGIALVAGLAALVRDVRVDVVDEHDVPGGFVQRYVIRGTVRATGLPLAAHHCIFVRVSAGRVERIDEYVDPTFLTQLGVET